MGENKNKRHMTHFGKYQNTSLLREALNRGEIEKPYVAIVDNALDYNSIEVDYTTMPFTIEILEGGESEFHLKYDTNEGSAVSGIEYEINGDGEWVPIESITEDDPKGVMVFNEGDIIRFRTASERGNLNFNTLVLNLPFKVYGNIMSLLYEPNDFTSATTFPTGSYRNFNNLFSGCTSLTDASNLVLPATELIDGCYQEMFEGCTNLTQAPALPATTLVEGCYSLMFQGCTNLNYIKCLATDISADYCTYDWVNGVSSTGTFTKAASMSDWSSKTGNDGIPQYWTVQDAS